MIQNDRKNDFRFVRPGAKRVKHVGAPVAFVEHFGRGMTASVSIVAAGLMTFGVETVKADELPDSTSAPSTYRIVIGEKAKSGEEAAAEELSHFLGRMTGDKFAITRDNEAKSEFEIVLGQTERLGLTDLPEKLQPEAPDGFALYRKDQKLFIIGKTPRGTLYGVYDFLEVELGCRFLAPGVNHIPRQNFSLAEVESRKYDPPLEYRIIWGTQYTPEWASRNRVDSVHSESKVGRVRFVGPRPHHTFGYLVPSDKYYENHPEYYALVGGQRHKTEGGSSGGLCLTEPDVLQIAIESVRQWIKKYQNGPWYHPDSIQIVSVSVNDESATAVCECSDCRAVNEEEDSEAGTLIRFVNAIAEDLQPDYPNVRIETLAYNRTEVPPAHTRPHDNVIIRMAPIGADYFTTFDDPDSKVNQPIHDNFRQWEKVTDYLYVWSYHTNFHAFFKPFPDLRTIDENIRFLNKLGLRGYFAEASRGDSVFRKLRNYVLAKCTWRPETDAREVVEEFCHLYYGEGGAKVLQFIDMTHDYVEATGKPLFWNDASRSDGIVYSYEFLKKANVVLAEAEAAAETDEKKHRVAEVRLSPWYLILKKAFAGGIEGAGATPLPVEWAFRLDPGEEGFDEQWHLESQFEDWDRIRIDDFWTRQGYDYHGTAWYAIAFDIEPDKAGTVDSVNFGAIDGEYHRIFLDGKQIHERESDPGKTWNQPFQVKLPFSLKQGRHVLMVEVRKRSHAAGIWKPVTLVDPSAGVPQIVREAGERFIEVSKEAEVERVAPGAPIDEYYNRIRALLMEAERKDDDISSDAIRQSGAMLSNSHNTFSIFFDDAATDGSGVVQATDRNWTLGQSMRWNGIDEHMRKAEEQGKKLFLRVRVRVNRNGDDGPAFRFGYARQYTDSYGATIVNERRVKAEELPENGWKWYELSQPLEFQAEAASQYYAFVLPANNLENVEGVYVDAFELVKHE